MPEHARYAPDERPAPLRAPLVPVDRTYPVSVRTARTGRRGWPLAALWREAAVGRAFFHAGRMEPAQRRTTFRAVADAGHLFLLVELSAPQPALSPRSDNRRGRAASSHTAVSEGPPADADTQDQIGVDVGLGPAADFPVLHVLVSPSGAKSMGVLSRPWTPYHPPPLDPVPDGAVRVEASPTRTGWRAMLALDRAALGLPEREVFINVFRSTAEGTYAWCDLWNGPPIQTEALGLLTAVDDPAPWQTELVLPTAVAVGANHLRLTNPDPAISVRESRDSIELGVPGPVSSDRADRTLGEDPAGQVRPGHTSKPWESRHSIGRDFPVDEDGAFIVPVLDRGPLDIELVHPQAGVVARYHADVARPLLVAVHEPFVPADTREIACDVTLNLAGEESVPVALTCVRGGRRIERQVNLPPGRHPVTLVVPAIGGLPKPGPLGTGNAGCHRLSSTGAEDARVASNSWHTPARGAGDELTVEALVQVPVPGRPIRLTARHWCAIGRSATDLDCYRSDFKSLSTRDLHWAVIADAVTVHRLRQAGCGAYGDAATRQNAWWAEAFVYVPALLYKTAHPANPHLGDRRLLESAVLGMEFALRPTISQAQRVDPDNRSLQAFLLTYDLLKDDLEPARRAYWAHELAHRSQGVVDRWLRAVDLASGLTSADCGTGSNHMAYHVANVYLAAKLFGREEWKAMAAGWLRRFAAHGAPGHFEERTGVPVNLYTWLSANGLAQYQAHSGDPAAVGALEAFARHGTAITTAAGGTMALHGGRNSHHGGGVTGTFVLSRTARGRAAARARLVAALGDQPSLLSLESLWRCAENAVHFADGPEEDFTADDEYVFNRGVIARRNGFHYGLSTIALGPVNGLYRLDPQNAVEVFHRSAGCILHGGNSALQPEAGSFCRPLSEGSAVRDLPARTAPRVDYLPITGAVKRLPDGHDLDLCYWSFAARVAVHVLSHERMRIVVTWRDLHGGAGPVVFNFFLGAAHAGDVEVDGPACADAPGRRGLRFGAVTIQASADFSVDTDFRLMNPYLYTFTYTHKPVRCFAALEEDVPFVLDIIVR